MKFRVQLLLCGGLLLSSLESQSAQNLSDDSRASLNVEISAKVSTDRPRKSGPETQSERSQSTSKFVTVDDTRLHFVIKGEGRPVVLIHGNPGSGQDWTRVFGPLSGLHKVIAFEDRKSTRLNSSHSQISYAVFCLKKKKKITERKINV